MPAGGMDQSDELTYVVRAMLTIELHADRTRSRADLHHHTPAKLLPEYVPVPVGANITY